VLRGSFSLILFGVCFGDCFLGGGYSSTTISSSSSGAGTSSLASS